MSNQSTTANNKIKLSIYGPTNQGNFVVHACGCADCGKLDQSLLVPFEAANKEAVAKFIYHDHISEGSTTVAQALRDFDFKPCVKFAKEDK